MTSVQRGSDVGAVGTTVPAAGAGPIAHRWLVLVIVALAQLMVVLDGTVVNIALPTAQADIGFNDDARQWVVTGYALAFGSLLLIGGRLGDLRGRKPLFLVGLVGFAASSALGGAADSLGLLVTARVAQGVFGAFLAPAALSLVSIAFPTGPDRNRAFAIFGGVSGAGGAVGLILGGALTQYTSWRWCLYINIPVAIVALIGALLWLPWREERTTAGPTLDLAGTILSVAGLVALVYGLGTAETRGWIDVRTVSCICVGLVLLAAFAYAEMRVGKPLLPMRILADRTRGGSYAAIGLTGAGMFGVFLFLTYFISNVLGYAPLHTGVAFLPMILALMVSAQLVAPLVARMGFKIPVALGFIIAATGLWLFTHLDVTSGYWTLLVPGLIIVGTGIGMVVSPAFSAATLGVETEDAGVASAAVNVFQQIGGAVATAILSALAAAAATDALSGVNPADAAAVLQASVSSYTTVFAWSAAILVAGAVVCGIVLPHGPVRQTKDVPTVTTH